MPADAIKKLAEIIAKDKRHADTDGRVVLREKATAALNHIEFTGFENEVVAIQLDKIGFADKTWVLGHPARRACDAVIFCQCENEAYILILDMKSSIPKDTKDIQQLLSGDCFADYVLASLKHFENIQVTAAWQRRYFFFHCGNNKRTTLPNYAQSPPNNNRADKAHILYVSNGESVPLRKLLHKPL